MQKVDGEKTRPIGWLPFVLLAVFVVLMWWFTPVIVIWMHGDQDFTKLGAFGDAFGAINALFSGLAFVGLFYAILLQRAELEAQRQELAETREVLKSQKQEAETQNNTLARQTFENMFFQLLRQHSELIGTLSGQRNGQLQLGRWHFEETFHNLLRGYQTKANNALGSMKLIEEVLQDMNLALEQGTGHYFRSLCGILRYADQSNLPNKETYVHLVRDQLSAFEVSVLFYRCAKSPQYAELKSLGCGLDCTST